MEKNKERNTIDIARFFPSLLEGERFSFIENLGMLISSGIGVLPALQSLKLEARSWVMQDRISTMQESLESGFPLWRALEDSGLFSFRTITLVRIGEASGRLSENLKVITLQQQKERSFQSQLRSAMIYPTLIFAIAFCVGIGVTWVLLPRLATVFSDLRINLPWITEVTIGVGNFLGKYGMFFVPIFLFTTIVALYIFFFFSKTRWIGQSFILRVPSVNLLIREIELARFGYILGSLLNAGLPVVEALNSLRETTEIYPYRNFYSHLKVCVEEGNSFKKSFDAYPDLEILIPISFQQVVAAGELSGRLPDTLISLGKIFEDKVSVTTKNFAVVVEPVLLVMVWFVVLFVALSIIMPIYSLISGLEQGTGTNPPQSQGGSSVLENERIVSKVTTQLVIEGRAAPYVNIRNVPLASGKILGQAYPGERYAYIMKEGVWYKIILSDGAFGWVSGAYVTVVE